MNNNSPVVSKDTVCVIMPAYNASKTIGKSVRSILYQSYKNLVIIIVDVGSTDFTYDIVSRIAKKDDRVVIIRQENRGTVLARTAGIIYARDKGIPFVCFCDSDDFLPKKSIEKLYLAINETGSDLVCGKTVVRWKKIRLCNKTWLDFQREDRVLYSRELIREKLVLGMYGLNTFPVSLCAKLYRMPIISAFTEDTPIVSFTGDDVSVLLKVLLSCNSVCTITDTVYHYQRGLGDGTIRDDMLDDYKKLFVFRKEIAQQHSLNDKCYVWLDIEMMNVLKTYFLYCCETEKNNGWNKSRFLSVIESEIYDSVIKEAALDLDSKGFSNGMADLVSKRAKEEIAELIEKQYYDNKRKIVNRIKKLIHRLNRV